MAPKSYPITVSAAEISRNFGDWQHRAMFQPVMITHHGRPRLILASIDLFEGQHNTSGEDLVFERSLTNIRLRTILNQMRDAFIAFDAEFRVLDANPAAELYFGSPKDELIGRDLRISIPEMQTSAGWSIFERVLRTAEPTDFTMNSPVYIGRRLRVQAFPYDHGLGVIFTNMAAIEEAHLLEKRSEAVQAALECEGAMSIIRLNARGGIEAVDNAFCGMSGFTQEQLLSLMLPEIVYMRDRPAVNGAFNACIREKKPKMASVALMAKDGSERALHLCMSAVFNDAVPAEVIVCAVDHTVSASNAAAAV